MRLDNLFEISKGDILLVLLSIFMILSVAFFSLMLRIKDIFSPFTIRNLVHISGGSWIFIWLNMENRYITTLLCLSVTVTVAALSFVKRKQERGGFLKRAVDDLSSGDETLAGPILYAISITALSYLFWEEKLAGASCMLILSLGDGMADLIGRNFGKIFYRFPWGKRKTVEGSLAFFISSAVALLIAEWVTSTYLLSSQDILLIALTGTFVEAISPENSDNILVPGVVALIFYLLH